MTAATTGPVDMHIGRSWRTHTIEDACPCEQAPCGLVPFAGISPDCTEHPPEHSKSMRQGHSAANCPGVPA